LDDFLQEKHQKNKDKSYRRNDAVVLTTALVAACFFYGNQAAA